MKKLITCVVVAMLLSCLNPIAANAEKTQTMEVFYTERQAVNEYEVSIPAMLNVNDGESVFVKLNEGFILEYDYAVHVDVDASSFNGATENNVFLFPVDSEDVGNYVALRIRRAEDCVDLHKNGNEIAHDDLTAAILHADSELDFGGELWFMVDDEHSRLGRNGITYSGSVSFVIYGNYE